MQCGIPGYYVAVTPEEKQHIKEHFRPIWEEDMHDTMERLHKRELELDMKEAGLKKLKKTLEEETKQVKAASREATALKNKQEREYAAHQGRMKRLEKDLKDKLEQANTEKQSAFKRYCSYMQEEHEMRKKYNEATAELQKKIEEASVLKIQEGDRECYLCMRTPKESEVKWTTSRCGHVMCSTCYDKCTNCPVCRNALLKPGIVLY